MRRFAFGADQDDATTTDGARQRDNASMTLTPVEALERIGYLLDRGLAEGYRVRAFQRGLGVVRRTDPDDLVERVRTGRLTELPGVGDAIAGVITDAVEGRTPAYLTRLEEETVVAVSPEGAVVRAALRGDCHAHSLWSDGGASIADMAATATALGHEFMVATDHSGRLSVANGLSRDRLLDQLDEIAGMAHVRPNGTAAARVLTGIEVDINEDGSLDADDDVLNRLDVVVASVHSKMRQDRTTMTDRLIAAVSNRHVNVLGHCTGRKVTGKGRRGVDADFDAVFDACARFDTAVEINCRPERLDPPRPLMARALEIGCRFVISTDAHAPGQMEWQAHGCDRAAEVGVPLDRIVNTRPVSAVVDWARSKRH